MLASTPAPRGPDTAPAPPAASQSSRAKSRYIDPEELVKILQEQEPLLAAGMATRQLAEILAPEVRFGAVRRGAVECSLTTSVPDLRSGDLVQSHSGLSRAQGAFRRRAETVRHSRGVCHFGRDDVV